MISDQIQFFLVQDSTIGNINSDFKKILSYLGTYQDIAALKLEGENKVIISYNESLLTATLTTGTNPKLKDSVFSRQMTLTCNKSDNTSINLVKSIATSIGYRIFNPSIESFCANDPNLVDLTTAKIEQRVLDTFKIRGLAPIYQFRNSLIYFAVNPKDKSVHLVNRHLLAAMLYNNINIAQADNFNVKVAPDITTFVALSDRGLIPNNFYQVIFNTKNTKVHETNLSNFNLDKANSDVYLAPVFFYLDRDKQAFVSLGHKKALSINEKVKKGNSIRKWVLSLVAKHKLGVLLAVKYPLDLDFINEKSGKVIPRIHLSIFVDYQN